MRSSKTIESISTAFEAGFLVSAAESFFSFLFSVAGSGFTSPSVTATASFLGARSEGVVFFKAIAATPLVFG
jgi:hypothetical protein